jgi:integrase
MELSATVKEAVADAQVEILQEAVAQLRDHAMVATLIGCGLRRAELLALCLESISNERSTGSLPISWVRRDMFAQSRFRPGLRRAVDAGVAWRHAADVRRPGASCSTDVLPAGSVWTFLDVDGVCFDDLRVDVMRLNLAG